MRMSDWSSDVCSSDLPHSKLHLQVEGGIIGEIVQHLKRLDFLLRQTSCLGAVLLSTANVLARVNCCKVPGMPVKYRHFEPRLHALGDFSDRKSTRLNSSH